LRLSPRPKFRLKPKISQKWKSFFLRLLRIAQQLAEGFAETKLRTERSLNPKLINWRVDFTCTIWLYGFIWVNQL